MFPPALDSIGGCWRRYACNGYVLRDCIRTKSDLFGEAITFGIFAGIVVAVIFGAFAYAVLVDAIYVVAFAPLLILYVGAIFVGCGRCRRRPRIKACVPSSMQASMLFSMLSSACPCGRFPVQADLDLARLSDRLAEHGPT